MPFIVQSVYWITRRVPCKCFLFLLQSCELGHHCPVKCWCAQQLETGIRWRSEWFVMLILWLVMLYMSEWFVMLILWLIMLFYFFCARDVHACIQCKLTVYSVFLLQKMPSSWLLLERFSFWFSARKLWINWSFNASIKRWYDWWCVVGWCGWGGWLNELTAFVHEPFHTKMSYYKCVLKTIAISHCCVLLN